jgi:hypothetical protein
MRVQILALCASVALNLDCAAPTSPDPQEQEGELQEGDVFSTDTPLKLELSAPLETLFARHKARAEGAAELSEIGKLTYGERSFDVDVSVRGFTSARACPFPKLAIDFKDKAQVNGTIFHGHGKLRVNTHCGEGTPDGPKAAGRVMSDVSPIREELAYRLVRAAGFETLKTRLSQITYTDTSGATVVVKDHFALVIESGKDAAQRYREAGVIDKETGGYINGKNSREPYGASTFFMEPKLVQRIPALFDLLGNRDWWLAGEYVWNIDVVGTPNAAPQLPLPADLDVSMVVTGGGQWDPGFSKATTLFAADGDSATYFAQKKEAIETALSKYESECTVSKRIMPGDSGFARAHERIDTFFSLPGIAGK